MKTINNELDFNNISEDRFWNIGEDKELKMHRIHSYPAKFPAFITTKAIEFARKESIEPTLIADIFCGCGTVAFEAKRNDIDFWGCDINPVATMIARAKSNTYKSVKLKSYYNMIMETLNGMNDQHINYDVANERLKYWYYEKQFKDLALLKNAIELTVSKHSKYYLFFISAFSNILKPTSRWLTKSIKPQLDPQKCPADVIHSFRKQCRSMIKANNESDVNGNSRTKIITANFLNPSLERPKVDVIITSPPYVTSYEYADLHQLSSLWLGYADDYRDLRNGSIGSLHHVYNFENEIERLNHTGRNIVLELLDKDKAKARSVAKYFLDMQQVAVNCIDMLSDRGLALFVIGDTEYKGIRIENTRHLLESLKNSGFSEISICKRKITGKILTPYRDDRGRFTSDDNSRKVYAEEFIVIGKNGNSPPLRSLSSPK